MKALFLLSVVSLPMLFTGCTTTVHKHEHNGTTTVVERRGVIAERPPVRHSPSTLAIENRPVTHTTVARHRRPADVPPPGVQVHTDSIGRYYWRSGRRVYIVRF